MDYNKQRIINELRFKAIKSSGSGGQHVNKTASKIELHFNIMQSNVLTEQDKALLITHLKPRLTQQYELILQCDDTRSQHRNKTLVIQRFFDIIETGLKQHKPRIPTQIPRAITQKRLQDKQRQAQKKDNRKKPDID